MAASVKQKWFGNNHRDAIFFLIQTTPSQSKYNKKKSGLNSRYFCNILKNAIKALMETLKFLGALRKRLKKV